MPPVNIVNFNRGPGRLEYFYAANSFLNVLELKKKNIKKQPVSARCVLYYMLRNDRLLTSVYRRGRRDFR